MTFPLRPYQQQALDAIQQAHGSCITRPLVSLPTGTGETVIFAHLCQQRLGRALILVHRDELVRRTVDKLRADTMHACHDMARTRTSMLCTVCNDAFACFACTPLRRGKVMETTTSPKTPLQIRLDPSELTTLDSYIARFPDFPPSRVDVVRKGLMEWLAQKLEIVTTVQASQPHLSGVAEVSIPSHQPLKAAWQPIVAFLQQRQNVPARPDEIVAALGCKAESLAAHIRFMGEAGIVGYQHVGQGKRRRKAYFLTTL